MRSTRSNGMRGFTLIEILIVVVILGILAAIIIPQFTDAAQDASVASARSQLQTMRSQVELYRVQNNGQIPASDGGTAGPWAALVAAGYLRAAPTWPSGFSEAYNSGLLTLTFDSTNFPIPDVDNSGVGDAADVTAIEAW
ncbi:MAG: prepilin-type N-terminal cleavage/methylation domain-containing protein [Phycisphaerales bacterium]|nr:prepilin-type N-terminal cleavage/methylation domain-containing protein [Phycisphaerales bacterium]